MDRDRNHADANELPPWFQAILETEQQQFAEMYANQQRRFEETLQQYSNRTYTPQSYENASSETARPPKERLDTPASFDASDLTLYPSWKLDMIAKLEVDGDAIGSLTNQGWGDILFQDTAIQQKALDWLQNARQRNTPLTSFLPDFDTKILEANGQLWEDRMKISMLKKALSLDLLKALITVDEAATYEEFCMQLRRLDDRLAKVRNIQAGSGRRFNPATNAPATQKDPDAMDWVSSNASQTGFRVPGLSYEDARDRRQRGVCIKCDRPGHIAAHCKSSFVPPQKKVRTSRTATEKEIEPKGVNAPVEAQESGKD
ncbi:hypothetical protein ACJ73_08879 [Blastomyces percursus]|uniref:CCHC-type domain-containing protein n=1 Tax=Blastomyces percursus TaxID=1658174 RepID=A0A1J9QK05_9EURO|nr:hypothetical protein ACJ73_08879 [Blastomyces percursus]